MKERMEEREEAACNLTPSLDIETKKLCDRDKSVMY